jgi:RNA polymerase sigma factor FliA
MASGKREKESRLKLQKLDNVVSVWEDYIKGKNAGDGEVYRNKLIENYLPLVERAASRIFSKAPYYVKYDDLVSAGVIGLIDAVKSYDPTRGIRFEGYSHSRISGSIIDELRELDWISRKVRNESVELEESRFRLASELGRRPTDEELTAELGVSEEKFKIMLRDYELNRDQINSSDIHTREEKSDYISITPDKRYSSPFHKVDEDDFREFLLIGANSIDKAIINLHYYASLSMKETGRAIGISESRVSQIHSDIMGRLRVKVQEKKISLEDFIDS